MTSYYSVTELPGNRAHKSQLDAIRTRYEWAQKFCMQKTFLEIACGSGIGLGLLANRAESVIGGDIDPLVLNFARQHYATNEKVDIMELDACNIVLDDESVDVAICFEATYYFPSLEKFLCEVKRVLRPGGIFLCSSVNS